MFLQYRMAKKSRFCSCLFTGDVSCTFSRSKKIIKCGNQECSANTDDTPVGIYKLGSVEWNTGKKKNWVNLYPQKKSKNGYWDYYCENPDTRRSKIALHPGSISLGCISIPNSNCWNKLEQLLKQQKSSSLTVTGVTRSGAGSFMSFSCNGSLAAGKQISKTVSVIGFLQVSN